MSSWDVESIDDGIRPVDSAHEYGDGLSVRVGDVVPYRPADPESVYGLRADDDVVACTVSLTNGTPAAFDLSGIELVIRCGANGKAARRILDDDSAVLDENLAGTLRPGRTVSATWAYSVPPGTAGLLDIEVCFPSRLERESITFTTDPVTQSQSQAPLRAATQTSAGPAEPDVVPVGDPAPTPTGAPPVVAATAAGPWVPAPRQEPPASPPAASAPPEWTPAPAPGNGSAPSHGTGPVPGFGPAPTYEAAPAPAYDPATAPAYGSPPAPAHDPSAPAPALADDPAAPAPAPAAPAPAPVPAPAETPAHDRAAVTAYGSPLASGPAPAYGSPPAPAHDPAAPAPALADDPAAPAPAPAAPAPAPVPAPAEAYGSPPAPVPAPAETPVNDPAAPPAPAHASAPAPFSGYGSAPAYGPVPAPAPVPEPAPAPAPASSPEPVRVPVTVPAPEVPAPAPAVTPAPLAEATAAPTPVRGVPAGTAPATASDQDKVRQIFRFLAAAEESRTRAVRTLDGAQGTVWFADLPDGPGIASVLEGPVAADEAAWLTVRRPQRAEPPLPSKLLEPWVPADRIRDFTAEHPPHLRRRVEPAAQRAAGGIQLRKAYLELDSHPDRDKIEKQYGTWEAAWRQWADRRREAEPGVRLYDRLHKMHEDAANLGESYELVIGFGRLTWQSPEGRRVERHLLTHRAVLRMDSGTGTLSAAPDTGAPGFQLEEGMLDAEQHVQGLVREEIREALERAADATEPEQLDELETALRSWVNAAHSAGSYLPGDERVTPHTLAVPVVGFTPALVLRERTRRSTLEALNTIARQVDAGARPTELLRYVAGGDGARTAGDEPAADGTPHELYFALPANEEQRTIAERLRGNRLVVVQGPPGTGKTHTIANLVTDLLAQGKRVLITSHTPRALRVVRDKLPESVRDLCVSRTEDGTSAQRELEASVQTILHRFAGYDPRAAQDEIDRLAARLAKARRRQTALIEDLGVLRDQETRQFPPEIGDYTGSLQQIAERLAAEAPRYEWIGPVPANRPEVTAAGVLTLLRATRAYTPAQQALAAEVPGPEELPSPGDFDEAVEGVRVAEEAYAAVRGEPVAAAYDGLVNGLTAAEQQRLGDALGAFAAARGEAVAKSGALGDPGRAALADVLGGRDHEVRSRHAAATEALTAAEEALGVLGSALVSGIEGFAPADALSLATTLHDALGQGQKLRGPLGIRTKLAKAVGPFVEQVQVDGRAPDTVDGAALVLARVRLELRLARFEGDWSGPRAPWTGQAPRLAALRQEIEFLGALMRVVSARADVLAAAAVVPELAHAAWHEPATESAVRNLLRVGETLRAAERPRRLLTTAAELLRRWTDRPAAAPALVAAREAVRVRDRAAYRAACEQLADVREAAGLRSAQVAARSRVDAAFPALAERIVASAEDAGWEPRLADLPDAWAWSAWRERMERLTDPAAERTLTLGLAEADDEIRITLSKLAAARAWHGSLSLLTGDRTTALKAYQNAVRRIKGKYQHRYRRDAQTALREAQSAVPAWIMPLHQVAETVPMDRPGLFDVVIVDEASQSGLEAMLLTWLADRIVVVGDSKQVSPSNIGLRHDEYFKLQDKLLTGLDPARKGLFGPESSFFDLTEALAAGRGTLMLKEHFRCMPEIIGFSNQLCYNGALLPLRQYGADRLPPMRRIHVEAGATTGLNTKLVNTAEARALVDALVECCADPAYAGRTMGVISLRASKAHTQELENLLATSVSYEEREARRIRVADAEGFQGDERDVMFISCVNSAATESGRVPGGYSGKNYEQRINVAASRARDQVWVFHSAKPEAFHENDLRREYLDHLSRPAEEAEAELVGEVTADQRHEAFESLFHQRVYRELVSEGYRVRPQYRVGRHAIDLVVEGGTQRLAVECDGDTFAEGENASTVAQRQRDLERVGWTFVRVRGSRFHLDRDQAMAPLREALVRLGIEPVPDEPAQAGRGVVAPSGEGPAFTTGPVDGSVGPESAEPEPEPVGPEPATEDRPQVVSAVVSATEEPPAPGRAEVLWPDPAAPAAPAAPAVHAEPPAPAVPGPAKLGRAMTYRQSSSFPVRSVAPACYRRVLVELQLLRAELARPDESPAGADAANLVFLRKTQNDRRARRERRVTHLQAFLDAVSMDGDAGEPQLVVPGALLTLELDGEDDGSRYVVAELAAGEETTISPSSPLGRALMWQAVGHEVEYSGPTGTPRRAVVTGIRAGG
ncbi:AAA domain-containing protein [Streptomyces sp. NPDC057939]|uniref:AAA domain-containing protein n=1 Tax=Streptomyces sp. NPDC057939 TaxID=3346284 RepID=UPI0036EC98D3